MLIVLCLFDAWAQTITGGFGTGLFAGANALNRFGWTATASLEALPLSTAAPWFGIGAEAEVGFIPRYCTNNCDVQGVLRLGLGPVFQRGSGFLQVGMRYAIVGPRRGFRPFLLSKAPLPLAEGSLRPFFWAEGLRATELGIGVEIGFAVRDRKWVFFPRRQEELPAR